MMHNVKYRNKLMLKIIIGLVLLMMVFAGCGKKETTKKAEGEVTIRMYITQPPPFSKILADLDKLGAVNYTLVLNKKVQTNPKSLDKIAFNFGAEVADALIALKSRDVEQIQKSTNELIKYAKIMGVSDQFLQLADSMRTLITQKEWDLAENNLEGYKSNIITELYNLDNFNSVIFIQFGGWIKGLYDVSEIILTSVNDKEATKMLHNKTFVNSTVHDLALVDDENVTSQKYFQNSMENLKKIKEIIFASKDGYFDSNQVKKLNTLSNKIVNDYAK